MAVTLPLHSTPLEPPSSQGTPARFGTQHISPVSGQSPGPPVLSLQIPFSQPTPSRIPETYIGPHQEEVFIGSHTGNFAAGIALPDISITGTDKSPRDISYLQDMPASSDMASVPYWPPHLTGTDPTSSLEAQYGSSGTHSFESPVVSAQMHVDLD